MPYVDQDVGDVLGLLKICETVGASSQDKGWPAAVFKTRAINFQSELLELQRDSNATKEDYMKIYAQIHTLYKNVDVRSINNPSDPLAVHVRAYQNQNSPYMVLRSQGGTFGRAVKREEERDRLKGVLADRESVQARQAAKKGELREQLRLAEEAQRQREAERASRGRSQTSSHSSSSSSSAVPLDEDRRRRLEQEKEKMRGNLDEMRANLAAKQAEIGQGIGGLLDKYIGHAKDDLRNNCKSDQSKNAMERKIFLARTCRTDLEKANTPALYKAACERIVSLYKDTASLPQDSKLAAHIQGSPINGSFNAIAQNNKDFAQAARDAGIRVGEVSPSNNNQKRSDSPPPSRRR